MEKEFYQVVEEIYRKGYFNGQRALIKVTDICVDDLTQAKVYAYGYVANRMFTQKKIQENGVLPGEGLAAFFSANADTDFETLYLTNLISSVHIPTTAAPIRHAGLPLDRLQWHEWAVATTGAI